MEAAELDALARADNKDVSLVWQLDSGIVTTQVALSNYPESSNGSRSSTMRVEASLILNRTHLPTPSIAS